MAEADIIQSGTGVTVTGTGSNTDPYVIDATGGAAIVQQASAPSSPTVDDLWIDTDEAAPPSTTVLKGLVIRRVAAQSIPNITLTAISFDTEDEDSSAFFAPTGTTITIPAGEAGIYAISASILGTLGSTGRCFGNLIAATRNWRASYSDGEDLVSLGITIRLAVADTIVWQVFQTTGGSQNVTARLEMWKLGT